MPRGVARARAPAPAPRKVSHRASAARQAGIRLNADEQQELVSHYLLEDGRVNYKRAPAATAPPSSSR